MKRRDFLKLLGVAGATMSTSCIETYHWMGTNSRKRYSYLSAKDEQAAKGEAYYASTCMECSGHCGVLVRVREGNAVKLEGNPEHPNNKGALCVRGHASLSRLYDPKRIKQPQMLVEGKHKNVTWVEAYQAILDALNKSKEDKKNNYYLSGRTAGSLSGLIDKFCQTTNFSRLAEFEPIAHANLRAAYKTVFGLAEIPRYSIENSDLLVGIGADIFETFLSPISHTVQMTAAKEKNKHWKWLQIEPHLTAASLKADERYSIKPASEVYLLRWLISELAKSKALKNEIPTDIVEALAVSEEDAAKTGITKEKLEHILSQVKEAKAPLFMSGGVATTNETGLEVATLTALLQWGLGTSTLDFAHSENYASVGTLNDMATTVNNLKEGNTGVFFVTRCNPAAHVTSFKNEFKNAGLKVGLGLTMDETLEMCDVVLPLSHFVESLDDVAPGNGILNLIQPVMEANGTKQEGDILLELALANGDTSMPASYEDYLYDSWSQLNPEEVFVQDKFLEKGFVITKLGEEKSLSLETSAVQEFVKSAKSPEIKSGNTLLITPSVRFFDGRSKDITLLSEIPDSLSSITYGEWVSVAEKTANALRIVDCDEVEIASGDFKVKRVVRVQPVMQEGVLVIQESALAASLGRDERSGEGHTMVRDITVTKVGHKRIPMLSGSMHQDKRGVNDRGTIPHNYKAVHHPPAGYSHDEHDAEKDHHEHEHRKTLYPDNHDEYAWSTGKRSPYRWAMAIDLATCTACTACVAACYIENNVSVAGPEEHLMGREMSWLRFEPYVYEDPTTNEENIELLPMLCQQCENAPCESVCPVFATYHNPDGLNAQIYNRCVGTRYCANNCIYKVRRFNYFDNGYKDRHLPLHSVHNPDVFVRSKGIMEKCTFCVHRIRVAKDRAKDENRLVKDGEVVPACAQTCATNAITFGNIYDEESKIHKLAHADSVHRIYEETGVEPSVYYLGKKGSKDEPRKHG